MKQLCVGKIKVLARSKIQIIVECWLKLPREKKHSGTIVEDQAKPYEDIIWGSEWVIPVVSHKRNMVDHNSFL